ncbi:MAG: universal stress protein [Nitrospira bacterium HGW-Nitrospira-1]|nr:MAG: universal stress protein [Nitrospira bacterium HGW-Nitrospira-1]
MEIKKILFATDFSEGSSNSLPYAVSIAKQYGAKLYFVHVIYDVVKASGWYVPHVSMDELYRNMEHDAKTQLEKSFIEEMGEYKDVEYIVLKGTPYEEISRFAEENKIDLIVIGTHGRKGLDRMLFGSTAGQVVRYAPCPVLTVRLPKHI